MKKICALIIVITLIFTLCSCKKVNDDISSSYYSEHIESLEASNITSEKDESFVSKMESVDTSTQVTTSTPVESTTSKPKVDTGSKEPSNDTSSKTPSIEENPKDQINFVPKQWPSFNSDFTVDYENTTIIYDNNVFYKGIRYAVTAGQNNGVDCSAIVTVGDNDEFLNCVSILDESSNEQGLFNIYNDRIYYLQYALNDERDYTLLNEFSICTVNLSGEDKRVEKKIDLKFTHIFWEGCHSNSKYLCFSVLNLFDGVYSMYRYDLETNELVNLNYQIGAHRTVYLIENRIFVWSLDDDAIYEYDIDFNNEKVFYKTNAVVHLTKDGFILKTSDTGDETFLDLNGNISKK